MATSATAPIEQTPDAPPPQPRARGRMARLPRPLWTLLGIALLGGLLPLRRYWSADVVLVVLSFTVPGTLALRLVRLPGERIREYPVYVPAASLFVLLFGGLACDLVGPHLGLARPLHGEATALTVLGICGLMWLSTLRAPDELYCSWRPLLTRPGLFVVLLLPVMSGAGALLLNNGHGGTLARICVGVTVLVLVVCLAQANSLSRVHVAVILFACALAAEWGFSLRSHEVIGFDVSTEIFVAQKTHAAGIWHTYQPGNAYAAMLSLTVLPSVLTALTGCPPLIAFKVVYPVLTALLPVSVFLVAQRFMSRRFAAGAAAVLLIQNYFFQGLPGLARQEIAMVLFAALIAVIVDDAVPRWAQLRVALLMALGLVVSHYSSTYLAISILLITLVLQVPLGKRLGLPRFPLAILFSVIALAGGAGVWYGAVTHSAHELGKFVTSLEHEGLNLLPNGKGGILNAYLNGNQGSNATAPQFQSETIREFHKSAPYIHPLPQAFEPQFQLQSASVPVTAKKEPAVSNGIVLLFTVFSEAILVLGVLGSVIMIFRRGNTALTRQMGLLGIATLGFLVFIRFSGTAASFYNQTRALLQSLLVLCVPIAWLAERLVARLPGRRAVLPRLLAVGMGVLFAYEIGAMAIVLGGGTSLNLSSRGEDYERQYMTPAELAGARWVQGESPKTIIQADRYGQLRMFATSGRGVLTTVVPRAIDRGAWIYGSRTNVVLGRARGQVGNVSGLYRWPTVFLGTYFDTVYDSGDSRVYHR